MLKISGLLVEVQLDAGGSWYTLLARIKSMLSLEETRIHGLMSTIPGPDDKPESWLLLERSYEPIEKDVRARDLEDFLVRGGAFSYTDDNQCHSW